MTTLADVIQRDTRANQPAASAVPAGTLYYVTDETMTERSTGSAWEDVSDAGGGLTNPMTAAGDVIYGGASGTPTSLAVGTAGQVLKVNAGATAPEWGAAGGGWTQLATNTLGGSTPSVSFSSISGAYTDLLLEMWARTDNAALGDVPLVRVGNTTVDSGTNYDEAMYKFGDTATSAEHNRATGFLSSSINGFIPGPPRTRVSSATSA